MHEDELYELGMQEATNDFVKGDFLVTSISLAASKLINKI